MPNWCENSVTIRHKDKQKLITLAKECMKDECRLFNLIVPQPDWETTPNDKGELPIVAKDNDGSYLARKFPDGSYDERWYNWNINNWGCKWDVGGFYQDSFPIDWDSNEYKLHLNFDTAWSPPIGVYNALVDKGYCVEANYFEGGIGYCGEYIDGDDNEYSFDDSNMPLKFREQIKQWRAED